MLRYQSSKFSYKNIFYNVRLHSVATAEDIVDYVNLTLGGLFRSSFCGGGKIAPFLNLVRIMLKTWNLVRKYTYICSFRKYTF